MAQRRPRSVLVLMHAWVGYLQGVQQGITQYVKQHPEWAATRHFPLPGQIARLGIDRYDGVISFVEEPYADRLRTLNVPVVNVSNGSPDLGFPAVFPDDVKIAQLAAGYLRDLGLANFACIGHDDMAYAQARRAEFTRAAESHGGRVFHFDIAVDASVSPDLPTANDANLLAWVKSLPKPIGVFATSDARASELLQACRVAAVDVPQEVCVLGTDNDEFMTDLSDPPLSSIEVPTQQIGYQAAQLLDRLMDGESAPEQPIWLPPVRVVTRRSTDLLAISDPDVLAAVRYIRDALVDGITVKDILKVVPLNRRYFEQKFKQHLGRTPLQEILRVRVDRVKELLATSDLSMPAIARRSGFRNAEQLATVFRRLTSMTPTQFRRQHRLLRD